MYDSDLAWRVVAANVFATPPESTFAAEAVTQGAIVSASVAGAVVMIPALRLRPRIAES